MRRTGEINKSLDIFFFSFLSCFHYIFCFLFVYTEIFYGFLFHGLKDTNKVGEAIWREEMGTDCSEVGWKSWQAVS
jgi:hypothetical protein